MKVADLADMAWFNLQDHLFEMAQTPEGAQKAFEFAESTMLERAECECGASGCHRSGDRWTKLTQALAAKAKGL